MQFMTTSEMRKPEAWEAAHLDKVLVTNHGKPVALVIPVTGDDLEETLEMISRMEAMRALRNTQTQARRSGTQAMSATEIACEIKAARAERRGGKSGRAPRS